MRSDTLRSTAAKRILLTGAACNRALFQLLRGELTVPIGLGEHRARLGLAELVVELTESNVGPVYRPLPKGRRWQCRPDVTETIAESSWKPSVALRDGSMRMIEHVGAAF